MATRQDKIKRLEQLTGKTYLQLAREATYDSLAYCICMNDGCCNYEKLEPDQDAGWCEDCQENSMKSILILLDLI